MNYEIYIYIIDISSTHMYIYIYIYICLCVHVGAKVPAAKWSAKKGCGKGGGGWWQAPPQTFHATQVRIGEDEAGDGHVVGRPFWSQLGAMWWVGGPAMSCMVCPNLSLTLTLQLLSCSDRDCLRWSRLKRVTWSSRIISQYILREIIPSMYLSLDM